MKKLTELQPEEKRILAAEACGWICCSDYGSQKFFHNGDMLRQVMWPDSSHHAKLPDYGNDRNAMAEAEATLTPEEHRFFRDELWRQIEREMPHRIGTAQKQERAYQSRNASQRLDAFLLAKGLAE